MPSYAPPLRTLTCLIVLVTALPASAAPPPCGYNFALLDVRLQTALQQYNLGGCGLLLVEGDQVIYENVVGTYALNQTVPIASATKWLSAGVLMSVVDSQDLTLDNTTGEILGWQGDKAPITVRQLFSHTSGIEPQDQGCLGNANSTLAACVAQIESLDLKYEPGTIFDYGGNSMHVAGYMCQVATGTPFVQLFLQRIAGPLGFVNTYYNSATNPRIAGGASSNLQDYGRFLSMLLAGGEFNGRQVLQPESVAAMLSDQTAGVPFDNVPPGLPEYNGYGIGTWVWNVNTAGQPEEFASPGAFGFTPWVDLDRGIGGVFIVTKQFSQIVPLVLELQQIANAVIDSTPNADLNCDGLVTDLDLGILLGSYGVSDLGDIDADGDTDDSDLGLLLSEF